LACVDPLEDPDWDRQLGAFPDATAFHTAAWARVLERSYGYRPRYLAIRREGRISALLPLMEVASPLTGRRGVSLPFTDCCEPLTSVDGDDQELSDAACRMARESGWRYLELRGGVAGDPAPGALRYFTHRLALDRGEEALWAGLDGSVRRAIRKARDSGVTVRTASDPASLAIFYRLHCRTRKRLGVPPQPIRFFENIRRHLLEEGLGTMFVASRGGEPIAAAIHLHFGGQVMFKYGASDLRYQQLRPNNLVMWEAIRVFAAAGRRDLHMGRNEPDNPGLRRYKLSWGCREGLLGYRRYCPREGVFTDDGKNPQQGWHHAAFRRIPVPLARLIGAAIYPHMA
jgi:CelD/BcsL family acetyltransferase involved in cellulose biosynthesis